MTSLSLLNPMVNFWPLGTFLSHIHTNIIIIIILIAHLIPLFIIKSSLKSFPCLRNFHLSNYEELHQKPPPPPPKDDFFVEFMMTKRMNITIMNVLVDVRNTTKTRKETRKFCKIKLAILAECPFPRS